MCDEWHDYFDKEENFEELTEKKEAIQKIKDSNKKKIDNKMDYSPEFQIDGYEKMKKPERKPKAKKDANDSSSDFEDLENLRKFLESK